ncbi:MAG: GNAT family N-acetyltransferase [bacterium]|nr:MAG: GNAT family N-acetyltransferase [bacterium]
MKAGQTIKKITRNYRDYGLRLTASKVSRQLVSFAFEDQTYRIYRIRLADHSMENYDDGGFTFRLVHPDEAPLIRQIEDMEEWLWNRVAEKLRSGSICLIAEEDGTVAGFNLVSFGDVEMPLVMTRRTFRPIEAWSEQITVGKDFRGRGLATLLRYHTFDELKRRGIRRFYGGTLPSNTANLKLSRKVGFREIADIRYVKRLNRRSWTYTRLGR